MDETIGVKGGQQDHIRMIRIDHEQKKKLAEYQEEKELEELEKDVKKKQKMILIKVLPIAIAGEIFQILYDNATGRVRINKNDEYSKWKIKEYDADFTTKARGEKPNKKEKIVVLPDGRKVVIEIPLPEEKIVEEEKNEEEVKEELPEEKKRDIIIPLSEEKKVEIEKKIEEPEKIISPIPIIPIPEIISKKVEEKKVEEEKVESVIIPSQIKEEKQDSFEEELSEKSKEILSKLKNRKIIDEYEKQLKEIRFELRGLIFDYNALLEDEEKNVFSFQEETILDRLNEIILKIEQLKERIKIEHIEDFDDNYNYTLIEDYLSLFQDKKLVDDIKDSPLYILISEKIDEFNDKKDKFKDEVEHKKKDYSLREERFDELREKFIRFDQINRELANFQDEQERIVREVREKVAKAVTVQEKVEVQVQAMNYQSKKMLRLMALGLFFPGGRAAKKVAATASAYSYFVHQILHPKTITKKYQKVTVQDYSSEIEYSISALENAEYLLKKTDQQIDLIIREIKNDFQDYIGILPECDELLSNLEKVKRDLHEKEYEMDRTKTEQERLLEANNAKVLTRGEYPM